MSLDNIIKYNQLENFWSLHEYLTIRNWNVHLIDKEQSFHSFEFDNLKIYFNSKHNQWRLKNTDANPFASNLDIININFPFNEKEQNQLNYFCSLNHGVPANY